MSEQKKRLFDRDTLSMVIAVCAVIISGASFYASYVQSEAALKQVKAETWPYLQIDHGNFDSDAREHMLYYKVVNAGVGPAHVKALRLFYEGEEIGGFVQLFRKCCMQEDDPQGFAQRSLDRAVTGNGPPIILSAGQDMLIFSLPKDDINGVAWGRLDAARRKLSGKACYCSLLDECYETDFVHDPAPVKLCRPEQSVKLAG